MREWMVLKKFKKIANSDEVNITCISPLPNSVVEERNKEYPLLSDTEFKRKYRNYLFIPAILKINNIEYKIQINYCNNTFCKWYGLPQRKYNELKSKPSRYKMQQTDRENNLISEPRTSIKCCTIQDKLIPGESLDNKTEAISNWSLAEEIKRLITINSTVPIEPKYTFHKEGCSVVDKTPFNDETAFYKRGTSNTNSEKFQCKECKKITNVLPSQDKSFNYHQQRNDILVSFTKDILSRTPVKRICEKLEIGSSTYYNKLEWIYKKCLEFNKRYETDVLRNEQFDELWINTDMMIYNLNNIRMKGKAGKKNIGNKEKKLQTYLVASADLKSGYVFRSDVAYDYNINLEQIEEDTLKYRCDHSYQFIRKNDRLQYSYCPQPPTPLDSESYEEYEDMLYKFNKRKDYVEGCHVRSQYTAMAHYCLLNKTLKSNKLYFISDDDSTLENSIFRVFSEQFLSKDAMYFTCQYENSLTLEEAGAEAFRSIIELRNWARDNGIKAKSLHKIGKLKLERELHHHRFYDNKEINGVKCPVRGKNPIRHPLPDKDEGIRYVNLISYIPNISDSELADLIMQVNSRAINNFFQEVRRRISILERPLTTARGDGKSYIYANYNPKYAQQIVTIFRTFYNFCFTKKINGEFLTPAQRLGITNKIYDYKDIIYFR